MTRKVVFARDYTDWAGANHKTNASAFLDESEADHVLRLGYAREEDTKKSTTTAKKES